MGFILDDFVVAATVIQLPEVDDVIWCIHRTDRVVRDDGPRAVVVAVPPAAAILPHDFNLEDESVTPGAQASYHGADVNRIAADAVA